MKSKKSQIREVFLLLAFVFGLISIIIIQWGFRIDNSDVVFIGLLPLLIGAIFGTLAFRF